MKAGGTFQGTIAIRPIGVSLMSSQDIKLYTLGSACIRPNLHAALVTSGRLEELLSNCVITGSRGIMVAEVSW